MERAFAGALGLLGVIVMPAACSGPAQPSGRSIDGIYTLKMTTSCGAIPESLRTRTYTAAIAGSPEGTATLSGARFWQHPTDGVSNQMKVTVSGKTVTFAIGTAAGFGVLEETVPGTFLEVSGTATGTLPFAAAQPITATLSANVRYGTDVRAAARHAACLGSAGTVQLTPGATSSADVGIAASIVRVEITGPATIARGSASARFGITASMSDGTTRQITDGVSWASPTSGMQLSADGTATASNGANQAIVRAEVSRAHLNPLTKTREILIVSESSAPAPTPDPPVVTPPTPDPPVVAPPMPDRVTLSGVVSIPSAMPCRVAAVVEVTAGADVGRTTIVDDAGRYMLANLHTGALTVQASAPGYFAKSASLTLTADHTSDIKLDPSPYLTTGRAIDALTQLAVAGLKVAGDGVTGSSCDRSGMFFAAAASGSTEPRQLVFMGPDVVERRTNVRVPGPNLLVSLISGGFDLRAFDEMFRLPHLFRWTTAPPLVVETRSLEFTDMNKIDAVALSDVMPDAEVAALVGDLTWALPQLTGGAFTDFSTVTRQQSAPGARVDLLNNDVITVSRVVGLTAATGYWGYGRWRPRSDGQVTGGMLMLDRDFDRSGSAFTRSLRAHELGHALGYQHVTSRASVMNSDARTEPTEFDREAARIAFQRPPGNRSPDVDPSSASINRRVTATWSPPIR